MEDYCKDAKDDESIVLNKATDEDDFAEVSASFVRFGELEDGSFQEFRNEHETE